MTPENVGSLVGRSHLRGMSSSWRHGKAFCDFQLNRPKKRGAIVMMGFSSAVGAQKEKGLKMQKGFSLPQREWMCLHGTS